MAGGARCVGARARDVRRVDGAGRRWGGGAGCGCRALARRSGRACGREGARRQALRDGPARVLRGARVRAERRRMVKGVLRVRAKRASTAAGGWRGVRRASAAAVAVLARCAATSPACPPPAPSGSRLARSGLSGLPGSCARTRCPQGRTWCPGQATASRPAPPGV